jgi:hypothetical protein
MSALGWCHICNRDIWLERQHAEACPVAHRPPEHPEIAPSDELTGAQRTTIAALLADAGPGATYIVDRDEDHDTHVFIAIFDNNGGRVLETIVEADGSHPDDDR